MSRICELLSAKGDQVHTISATSSVLDAVKRMHELKIGCLVVMGEGAAPRGMITERDVLRRIATVGNDLANVAVDQVMTKRVIVCGPDDQIDKVRSIMKHRYIRQLPVVNDAGQMLGIVSLGDVNSYQIREEETEIKHLHDYIHGQVR